MPTDACVRCKTGEYKRGKDGVTEAEACKGKWCGQTCPHAEHESARHAEQQYVVAHASKTWCMEVKHSKHASNQEAPLVAAGLGSDEVSNPGRARYPSPNRALFGSFKNAFSASSLWYTQDTSGDLSRSPTNAKVFMLRLQLCTCTAHHRLSISPWL